MGRGIQTSSPPKVFCDGQKLGSLRVYPYISVSCLGSKGVGDTDGDSVVSHETGRFIIAEFSLEVKKNRCV